MINVTEIMKRGAENKELPPWVNMRHAWMVNDGLRDKDLEYPENVVQIKNLDYKKRLDAEQFAAIWIAGRWIRKGRCCMHHPGMRRTLIQTVMYRTVCLIFVCRHLIWETRIKHIR